MQQAMTLQFTHQAYQERAVQSVVQVFDGQPLATGEFELVSSAASVNYAGDGSIGNSLVLTEQQVLENVHKVQASNQIDATDVLQADRKTHTADSGEKMVTFCPHFTIEMETGTGKTYTFIRTMFELNKVYGFKKFVVVVPSVAIREGTMKNLEVTRSHFAADYANVPCLPMLYDSNRPNDLRHFAQSDALSVLVINIDSFSKDIDDSNDTKKKSINKINQKGERAFAPIEYIKAVKPIVIVDEPQNFETDIRRKAIRNLNPLCTLRYSATHKNPYNLLYKLDPVQAYDLGLVKQIEVDGVESDQSQNQAFIELVAIEQKAKSLTAKVVIDVNEKTGVKRKSVSLQVGDDLYKKSKYREIYADGFILNEFLSDTEIEFNKNGVLRLNEQRGGLSDDVMRFQIERTVAAHFAKLKKVKESGIKVLSLFFIDKVANYRAYDDEGNAVPGKFAQWFEEAFEKYAAKAHYQGLIPHAANEVHNGYFSGDKKTVHTPFETRKLKSNATKTDIEGSAYNLIMQDKERLLGMDEPLQFIFSHSALREGWDNPNVFQICTLNETQSQTKKRQEIGRGLRLPVNQLGERIHDKSINVLTVIPNESYEVFARTLQQEIEDETDVSFKDRVKNARAKARVQRKALSDADEALFKAIWQRINYQTRYSVTLDTPELIEKCVEALTDTHQYPRVQAPKVRSRKAKLHMNEEGIQGVETGIDESNASYQNVPVPNVYAYIQNHVHLTRATLFAILDQSNRLDELLINPQAFLNTAIAAIKTVLQELLVQGIEYHEIKGQRYEMTLFDEPLETYLSSIYPQTSDNMTTPVDKTLLEAQPLDGEKAPEGGAFTCVMSDSEPENRFAHECSLDPRVRFFFKLPGKFKIATPLGTYNPDWAVVFENEERVYFVAETKSSTVKADLRRNERLKIECGHRHFKLADDVTFKEVSSLSGLVAQ
ncbi:DEAD/DEAH box helicase family protein [Vreelandella venusta]|uniref:restriction endonuclease n=1 Tax=Vreelandella venusta TaxID=44935 RepID=UPI00384DD510